MCTRIFVFILRSNRTRLGYVKPWLLTWHCSHLLLNAMLWPRAAAPLLLGLSIDMSCIRDAQQQTRRAPRRLSNDGTDGWTDGRPTVTHTLLRILYGQHQSYYKSICEILIKDYFRRHAQHSSLAVVVTDSSNLRGYWRNINIKTLWRLRYVSYVYFTFACNMLPMALF